MPQVLTSVNDLNYITETAKNSLTPIAIIGYLDDSFYEFIQGDLLLYKGSIDNMCGYGKQLLSSIRLYLVASGLIVKQRGYSLLMFDKVVVKYQQITEQDYSSGTLLIKLVDGLNNFGIASYEIYNLLSKIVSDYSKINSKKGDD